MRAWRMLWRRIRGWWLLTVAAAVTAALAAVGQTYAGAAAAVMVAAGGAVVAAISERGRSHLADQAKSRSTTRAQVYLSRVDQNPDPIRLGVHPAAVVETTGGRTNQIPPFVERDRLAEMKAALIAGKFVLVVGDSTAGKSRLAYEAMRACLPRRTCVKPENPDDLTAAITAAKDAQPSVLWLDDLERYLRIGGLTHGDMADLLDNQKVEVTVLATMRAHEREDFSARYDLIREHTERQAARAGREVLHLVDKEIRMQRMWSPSELAAAKELARDPRIAQALRSADKHGLAEHMAAGPQLLSDLRDAQSMMPARQSAAPLHDPRGGPRGAALVTAAIDARLAGYHRPIPLPLLRDLHEVYLRTWGGAALRPDSWDNALAWATQPLHGTSSLLEPVDDGYLAFDYLVDVAARDPTTPPIPKAAWQALIQHAELADAVEVARRASLAGRIEYAELVFARAVAAEEYAAAADLADYLGDAGREDRAVELLEMTIADAETSPAVSAEDLLTMRHTLAWQVGEKIGGYGDPKRALELARHVVRDSTTVHGAAHPKSLLARMMLARQVGAAGDPHQALAIAREVDAEATAALGTDDHTTLSARFEIAIWTRVVDGAAAGAERFAGLIQQAEPLETIPKSLITHSMWNLGGCLSDAGDHSRAIQVSEAAVDMAQQIYGKRKTLVLHMRLTNARAVGASGDSRSAASLSDRLADDCAEIIGESHTTTLEARHAVARWTAAAGDDAAAARLYDALQADLTRLLDHDHWLARRCRVELAELKQHGGGN